MKRLEKNENIIKNENIEKEMKNKMLKLIIFKN